MPVTMMLFPLFNIFLICSSGICHAASGGLQHDRPDIAPDKDPDEELGFEATVLRPNMEDDVFKREIDPCGHEGEHKNEAENLELKS